MQSTLDGAGGGAHVRRAGGAVALYGVLIAAQVRSQMQYKTSFVLEALGSFLGNVAEFAAILIFFQRFETIGGWRVPEVALLYGLVALPFAVVHLFGQGLDEFNQHIRQGTFDQMLVRPRTAFLQVLASKFQLRQLGRLGEGLLVLGLALWWLDAWRRWGASEWLLAGWTMVGGVLFFLGLMVFGATLCFWTVESIEAINILTYGGSEMARYPLHIFGDRLRRLFVYVVPLAFVNYVPTVALLDRPVPFGLPAWAPFASPLVCGLVLAGGMAAWRVGVRHYLSTGS
ncbi:ABC transporter permease [bacterium]|nr:ABC transporter permease [Chloroflexi bacterium CFX6]RIL10528.1 MAG: ABC transporter permease [bacterium]